MPKIQKKQNRVLIFSFTETLRRKRVRPRVNNAHLLGYVKNGIYN